MKITMKDGTIYDLADEITTELDDTYDMMTVHEIFEEQAPSVLEEHRYDVWLGATSE